MTKYDALYEACVAVLVDFCGGSDAAGCLHDLRHGTKIYRAQFTVAEKTLLRAVARLMLVLDNRHS